MSSTIFVKFSIIKQMKLRAISFLPILLLTLFATVSAQLEPRFDFYTRGPYRANVPTPQKLLRFDVGDHHTTYAQMEQVMTAIQRSSPDRVKIFEIGTTPEHRMQYVVAISSPENIARLDEIRTQTSLLTDPRKTSSADADRLSQQLPATAWMAYTIHGNESSSFEAMMQVMYQLAASDEPQTLEILKNTVVLIIPGENPDGHERFVTWYNSVAVGSPDRNAIEHREPWAVWGRVNHYRFNLNRDTLAMTQKETQNMAAAYQFWNPQVAVDHHGQPSQYFFPPVALPINPNFPQPVSNQWMDIYGRANAQAFDKQNWDYYVRDIFDAFYPGYWDTYPSLNGAIGMTYETDGGGFKGLNWTRDDGTNVTFRSSIAKHYVASMTTLETTAKHKTQRLRDFHSFKAKGMADHASSKIKRFVLVPDSDRVKTAEMVEVLRRSNIEVKVASSAFTSTTAHNYLDKNAKAERKTFPAGSYIIDLDQPQRILIKSILEQDTPQDKAFVDENMARFKRNQKRGKGQPKEDYGFYDLTAWSMPLSFGVEAYWTEETSAVASTQVTAEMLAAVKKGEVSGRAQVAYIVPYESDATGAFILKLTQHGYKVAVSTRQLNAGGRNWKPGTFVIRVSRNHESLHNAIAKFASEMGIRVVAVNSGYADEGDTSIGGEAVLSLQQARIAIAADEGVDQESYGSIWWTFDKHGIKFTPMTLASIRGGALNGYNILILPDGSPGRYFSSLGSGGIAAIKDFAAKGGNVITIRGSAVFATMKDVELSSSKLVGDDDDQPAAKTRSASDDAKTPVATATPDRPEIPVSSESPPIVSATASENKIPEYLPGAFMLATIDRTTYLNYGVEQDETPVLVTGNYFFKYSKEGTNAVIFDAKQKRPLTVSGFTWEGNTEELLKGTSYLIDESAGRGRVILFAEDPFYRGMTRVMTRQFFNSMIFNGIF